ncbi:hypothetical protein MMC25_005362 [Agyrium rufum]|nr:hypothetical protein [Agyrium rufum]
MLVPVKDAPLLGTDYRHVSGRDPHSFARLPGGFLPEPGTLQHLALKGLAKNWDETSVYYMWYLAELPGWLKEALLCYIACYSPKGISLSSLTTLMLDDGRIPAATNSEDVTRLDLARSSVAGRFNMLDLAEYLLNKPTEASPLHSPSSSFSASNSSLSSASGFSTITPYSRVPDSWDEDSPPPNKMARNGDLIGFIAPCPTLRFPFLTHLSLAYSPNSDWSGLIELSPALRTLTHLSLAGWSQPTGNMFRRPELHELCPKAVGGSCRESCRVVAHDRTSRQIGMFCLRRLSRTLICLKWLDLEGCDWIWMLEPGPPTRQSVARKLDWPERSGEENGIDWCGGWRGLETINRTPTGRTKVPWESIRKYQALFDSREARLKEAQATGMTRNEASALRMLPEAKFRADNDIHLWWAKEREALEVERRIRQRRNALGLKGIFFENGIPPEERALVEKVVNKWEFATDAGVYLPPL